jgi:hypothetical protein
MPPEKLCQTRPGWTHFSGLKSRAVLDIFLSCPLYFLTIVGGANCYNKGRFASTSKMEPVTLIKQIDSDNSLKNEERQMQGNRVSS